MQAQARMQALACNSRKERDLQACTSLLERVGLSVHSRHTEERVHFLLELQGLGEAAPRGQRESWGSAACHGRGGNCMQQAVPPRRGMQSVRGCLAGRAALRSRAASTVWRVHALLESCRDRARLGSREGAPEGERAGVGGLLLQFQDHALHWQAAGAAGWHKKRCQTMHAGCP